jgi:uncharacterized membrane protein
MATMIGLSLTVGIRFWLLGAWMVLPFSAVEVGLVALMFRLNAREALGSELLVLHDGSLRILRTEPSGRRRETVLPSGWLSVTLEERNGRVPRLMLRAHGVREEVARALGEAAKRDLAVSLIDALHRVRNPRFDNPQLRD